MNREKALQYVSYVIDDSGNERELKDILPSATLVGFQCGFEPMFVAVQSYLPDCVIDEDEAIELCVDLLKERNWFSNHEDWNHYLDYVIIGEKVLIF
jgi:hypothetical protein